MFVNFEKAFFKKNELKKKIPEEVLKSLSENLPEGFVYTNVGDGAIKVIPQGSEFKIGGFKIETPPDFNPSTLEELFEFMYRAQRKLILRPDENNCISINGTSFNIDELIKFPLENSQFSGFELSIVPQPFQLPFEIQLEGNGIIKKFLIQRQPLADMHKSLFKSINNHAFEITYIIDELEGHLNFEFKLNNESSQSVEEVIEALKLYHSCLKSDIKLNDVKLPMPTVNIDDTEEKSIFETFKFWEKVLMIQSILNVKFIPKLQIEKDDVIIIEELHRALIDKKPFKKYINIENITVDGFEGIDINDFLNKDGLTFQFIEHSHVNVLGVELDLYSIVFCFDFIVKDIESINEDKTKCKLILQSIEEKEMYQSIFHFCSEAEASEYRNNISNISEFQNAEELKI